MPRVLVTGALGNVGRKVVLACGALPGLIVRAAERRFEDLRERYAQHETTAFDFTRRETWAPAVRDCDYVFLVRPPPLADMSATLNPFVDVAYQSGVKHIVFLSVARANEMKWVPHRKVELHLERHGTAWTLLRPGFFAQNLQDAYRPDIIEDRRLYVPAGHGRVAFLDVRDVGAKPTEGWRALAEVRFTTYPNGNFTAPPPFDLSVFDSSLPSICVPP